MGVWEYPCKRDFYHLTMIQCAYLATHCRFRPKAIVHDYLRAEGYERTQIRCIPQARGLSRHLTRKLREAINELAPEVEKSTYGSGSLASHNSKYLKDSLDGWRMRHDW